MPDSEVGRFFDGLTENYTSDIERCFPRYREMLWALLDYLPPKRSFASVLELGCGTGNLSVLLREAFPSASLCLVDISADSLEVCRSRFRPGDRAEFRQQDFGRAEYDPGSFDLVISSIAIHHLDAAGKQSLFERIYQWLEPGGVLCFADQFAAETEDLYLRHIANWKELTLGAGSSQEQWDMWMQHLADHDHHDTLLSHIQWLMDSGFAVVDCPWRYLLWSVLQARK